MARRAGLAPHDKRDSTGICFVGERRFAPFLARFIDEAPGPIETENGTPVGEHRGLAFFTIGQRRGLGIGGGERDSTVVRRGEGPRAQRPDRRPGTRSPRAAVALAAGAGHALDRRPRAAAAVAVRCEDPLPPDGSGVHRPAGERDGNTLDLRFERLQWAAAPGQYAVLYDGDECLGGGVIESAEPPSRRAAEESVGRA